MTVLGSQFCGIRVRISKFVLSPIRKIIESIDLISCRWSVQIVIFSLLSHSLARWNRHKMTWDESMQVYTKNRSTQSNKDGRFELVFKMCYDCPLMDWRQVSELLFRDIRGIIPNIVMFSWCSSPLISLQHSVLMTTFSLKLFSLLFPFYLSPTYLIGLFPLIHAFRVS